MAGLIKDPQNILYSAWLMKRISKAVQFQFVYLCSTKVWFEPSRIFEHNYFDRHLEFTPTVEAMRDWSQSQQLPPCACGKCEVTVKPRDDSKEEKALRAVEIVTGANEFDLYIDCLPLKEKHAMTLLDTLISERCAEICKQRKVDDIRLVEFGKGKGYLADSFRKSPPIGAVYARSRSDLAQSVIDVLIPVARKVFIHAP